MHNRLGCSTISFRHRPLAEALEIIKRLGFNEIDLGALPGVCTHVGVPLNSFASSEIANLVKASGMRVRTINLDLGPLNDPKYSNEYFKELFKPLISLAIEIGAESFMLPCGAQNHTPFVSEHDDLQTLANRLIELSKLLPPNIELMIEAPHVKRFCNSASMASKLLDKVDFDRASLVLDTSHVYAGGDSIEDWIANQILRINHVQFRDAKRNGEINFSLGNGEIDFGSCVASLESKGYLGSYTLELETHDLDEDLREEETKRAGELISSFISKYEVHNSTKADRKQNV